MSGIRIARRLCDIHVGAVSPSSSTDIPSDAIPDAQADDVYDRSPRQLSDASGDASAGQTIDSSHVNSSRSSIRDVMICCPICGRTSRDPNVPFETPTISQSVTSSGATPEKAPTRKLGRPKDSPNQSIRN